MSQGQFVRPTRIHPDEAPQFTFPFGPLGLEQAGRTLASAALVARERGASATGPWAADTGITVSAFVASGTDAQAIVSTPTLGFFYRITVRGTDDLGNTHVGEFFFECAKANAGA